MLRQGDVAEEVAFLAMELDYFGLNTLGELFIESYVKESNDNTLMKIIDFYKSYRAYVRGKVAIFNAESEEDDQKKQNLIDESILYFKLAHSYFGV